jgi:hypothetical protein
LKAAVDAAATNIDNGCSVAGASDGILANSTDFCAEDSAAGIFVHNSFVCGAVARSLKNVTHHPVLPVPFCDFYRAFWSHQVALAADGLQLPGFISKFVPILESAAGDSFHGCSSMWGIAFDGGAQAASVAASAVIARAPFCCRYIDEVVSCLLIGEPLAHKSCR